MYNCYSLCTSIIFKITYVTRACDMACFIKSVSREAIKDLELGNPFLRMKLFSLAGVEASPLTLEDVPQHYRPYPGCLFVRKGGGRNVAYRMCLGGGGNQCCIQKMWLGGQLSFQNVGGAMVYMMY